MLLYINLRILLKLRIMGGIGTWRFRNTGCGKIAGSEYGSRQQYTFRKRYNYGYCPVYNTLSVPVPKNIVSEPYTKQRNLDAIRLDKKKRGLDKSEVVAKDSCERIFTFNTEDGITLRVMSNGELVLWEGTERKVANAKLSLPDSCHGVMPKLTEHLCTKDKYITKAVLRWNAKDSEDGYAELHISPTSDTTLDWCDNLSRGLLLDFQIKHCQNTAAEIAIEIGEQKWFGGGHFIRQLWPLNDAAIEVRVNDYQRNEQC